MKPIVDCPATADKACAVTYRASVTGEGREVEVRLYIDAKSATVADAWARLTALHPGVDPRSLEIEIRETAGA